VEYGGSLYDAYNMFLKQNGEYFTESSSGIKTGAGTKAVFIFPSTSGAFTLDPESFNYDELIPGNMPAPAFVPGDTITYKILQKTGTDWY
jgi:hypothetical protein